jgi:hypothetical protein
MNLINVPAKLTVKGQEFWLNIERVGEGKAITLTYEYKPIREDNFLIAAYGINLEAALKKMDSLLKTEKLL